MAKKGEILEEVLVEDFAAESKCVARVEGQVIFIGETAPGDVADIRITRRKKKFLEARPVYFHKFSSKRETPFCGHYGLCGGCRWQHVQYLYQLEFKQQQVLDQLQRIGHFKDIAFEPILPAPHQVAYRNKLEFTFTDQRWLTNEEIKSGNSFERRGLGFHKPGEFDKVLDVEKCFLQPDLSNRIRLKVKEIAIAENIPFYNLKTHEGFLRNLILRNNQQDEWMVILQVKYEHEKWVEKILKGLENTFPEISSLYYIINSKQNESYQDQEVHHFSGNKFIRVEIGDLSFRINPKSFFQTNTVQAAALYNLIRNFGSFSDEDIVYDLYTGTGTIANFIARDVRKVVGIEYIAEAIEDARTNSEINQIENAEFFEGDIAMIFNETFLNSHGKPDVIITDPPRAGMHKDVIDAINKSSARRVIYISCNPATQARDMDMMRDNYQLVRIQPIDMFPHTQHIENIAILDKI